MWVLLGWFVFVKFMARQEIGELPDIIKIMPDDVLLYGFYGQDENQMLSKEPTKFQVCDENIIVKDSLSLSI